jgi:hypothetical protein
MMKLLLGALVVLAARPADACGVPDNFLAGVAEALKSERTPIHQPVIVLGIGGSAGTDDGMTLVGRAGYGWGERTTGLFPGDSTTRVLVGVRKAPEMFAVGATYGWAGTGFGMSGALDVGVEAEVLESVEVGPTASLTIGARGLGAQIGASMMFGETPHAIGTALLVFDMSGIQR